MLFNLRAPCRDCPFIKDTTMVLRPGRMVEIASACKDDHHVFPCHKTLNSERENEETGKYEHDGNKQACMGALAYALKRYGQIPILARLAIRAGETSIGTITRHMDILEEPGKWKTTD